MGSNDGEHVQMSANATAECSEAIVEIKIKTLDSKTFTLRVDKCVPVPELKERIASVTGVLSEQQRLICRGKVLKDNQLLSAYHVEDGHTLHLVVRQPLLPSLDTSPDPETDPSSTAGRNPGSRVSPGVLIGTFNISENGDGAFPDLNRIVSAVINSVGGTRFGGGGEGIDLNQLPSELLTARGLPSDQTASAVVPIDTMQPPVIPDSLTTLLQYMSHLGQDFLANAGGQSTNAQNAGLPGNDRLEFEASLNSTEPRRLLTPESLANVVSAMRQLLLQPVSECLEKLTEQLESQSSVTDPLERSRIQSRAIRSGVVFQNLGALLLELGRAIMILRMGQTPSDALVNAGPPVFISSAGPNPIMVQSLPLHPGTSVGSPVLGASQHGFGLAGGSIGAGFLPRNIDIRIRTGSLLSRREPTGSQTQGQASIPSDSTQHDAATVNLSSGNRESQVGPIPIRTVAASVPASVGRGTDSSRSPVGIIFPVLARLQAISSGASNGSRTSQALVQQHDHNRGNEHIHDSAAQYQNVAVPGGNGNNDQGISSQNISGGLDQLLSTIFSGEHVIQDYATPRSAAEASQNNGTLQEPESVVSDEGLLLSLMLRQVLPMLSNDTGAESSKPSADGANSDETQVVIVEWWGSANALFMIALVMNYIGFMTKAQADGSPAQGSPCRHRGPQTQPGSKRQRRE